MGEAEEEDEKEGVMAVADGQARETLQGLKGNLRKGRLAAI